MEVVRALLDRGAAVDAKDVSGREGLVGVMGDGCCTAVKAFGRLCVSTVWNLKREKWKRD